MLAHWPRTASASGRDRSETRRSDHLAAHPARVSKGQRSWLHSLADSESQEGQPWRGVFLVGKPNAAGILSMV